MVSNQKVWIFLRNIPGNCHGTLQGRGRLRVTDSKRLLLYGETVLLRSHEIHPKTLFEMWITCLDWVSANSEEGRGSEWAVRVGQRLQSRLGRAEQFENWIWYKLSRKCRQIEGVCQALSSLNLFLAGAVATFCGDYGEGLRLRPHGQKHIQTLALDLC